MRPFVPGSKDRVHDPERGRRARVQNLHLLVRIGKVQVYCQECEQCLSPFTVYLSVCGLFLEHLGIHSLPCGVWVLGTSCE